MLSQTNKENLITRIFEQGRRTPPPPSGYCIFKKFIDHVHFSVGGNPFSNRSTLSSLM